MKHYLFGCYTLMTFASAALIHTSTASADEAASIPGWRYNGTTRVAVGLTDTSSRSGVTFSTADVFLNFSAKSRSYFTLTEIEASSSQLESEDQRIGLGLRQVVVGYGDEKKIFNVKLGRLLLSGVSRFGSEAAARRNDESMGRLEGLRIELGSASLPFHFGVYLGNSLGAFGASTSMAESAMNTNPNNPRESNPPKGSRAGAFYADACVVGICAEGWFQQEKDYFTKAPSVSRAEISTGSTPDGIFYERMRRAEVGLHYSQEKLNSGAWYRKTWLKDPKSGALASSGSSVVTGTGSAGNSQWSETWGIGAEFGPSGLTNPAIGPSKSMPFVGITFEATRKATDGIGETSTKAMLEDDEDIKEIGISAGMKDAPATFSFTVVGGSTAGKVFSSKKGTPNSKDQRLTAYSTFTFAL